MDQYTKLMTKLTHPKMSIEDKLKEICLTTVKLIKGADRVSLWRFCSDKASIESLICFDTSTHSFSFGQVLKKEDYLAYFQGILKEEVINAPTARTHELTQCFNESYFIPHDIYSLLDYILHQDFEPYGVLCCESIGSITQWSEADVETLKKLARASSMYFKIDD
ncbi:GAF domain-containing protein [Litorilituus lipolyticus]|uniref:GAF domain-containing protein n=1 Tax=Litorilituus lipolyticus TaxID=2491017 RepID=A0A502L0Y4_9GAMM|nr:GAF domain-containing protein [Litorilituus lipolyticus]TPH16469.1 GAF domain-containing protein [Litorilituus lipolyticus]